MRKVEDTKGVIRSRKSKKDRQYNGQKKEDKRTNNILQSTTQKTIDWIEQHELHKQIRMNSGIMDG